MNIDNIDKIHSFKDKHKLIKTVIYVKLAEMDITIPENDLNVLALFALDNNKDNVIQKALKAGYIKSKQSGENKVSLLVTMKLLEKVELKKRKIAFDILPEIRNDYVFAKLRIHNVHATV